MIRTTESSSSSPYLPQESPNEVPHLPKMLAMTSAESSKSENVPALIQADANSNYQAAQQAVQVTSSAVHAHQIIHPIVNSIPHPLPPPPSSVGPPGSHQQAQVEEDDDHVKRPMNAFMVWSRTERRKLALKFPNMLNCEISKLLGAEWSRMSDEDKSPYVQESKRLRTIHSQKYPDYSYKPRRRKRKTQQSQPPYPSINFQSASANIPPPYQYPPAAGFAKISSDAFKMSSFGGGESGFPVPPLNDPGKALSYLNSAAAIGLPDMKSYYSLAPPNPNLFPPSSSNSYTSLSLTGNTPTNLYSSSNTYMPAMFKDGPSHY
eukprot:TCONS_00070671-protein